MRPTAELADIIRILKENTGFSFKATSRPPVNAVEALECTIPDELTALRAKYYITKHTRLLPGIEVIVKDLQSPSRRGRKPIKTQRSGWDIVLTFSDKDAIRFFHYYLDQREKVIREHLNQQSYLINTLQPQLNKLTGESYKGIMVEETKGWNIANQSCYETNLDMRSEEPELRLYHSASSMDDPSSNIKPTPFHHKRNKVLRMQSLGIKAEIGYHGPDESEFFPSPFYIAIRADSSTIIQIIHDIYFDEKHSHPIDEIERLYKNFTLPYKRGMIDPYWDYSAPVPDEKLFIDKLENTLNNYPKSNTNNMVE